MSRSALWSLPSRSPVSGLNRRRLGPLPVLAQSVAAVAPCGSMATIPAIVLGATGAGAVLAFACAMIVSLLISWCIRQFACRMGAAGGLYSYTAKGLNPPAALVTGWSALLGYATVAMAGLLAVGIYLADITERLGVPDGARTPTSVVFVVLAGAAATLIMFRGIQLSSRVALLVECVSIVLVVVVLGALVVVVLPSADLDAAFSSKIDLQSLALGIVVAMSAFVGFESATTLGVEAHRPLGSVPSALRWTVPGAGVLYLFSTTVQSVTPPAMTAAVAASGTPLADVVSRHEVGVMSIVLDIAVAASFFGCTLASVNALVRVMFCMGREGALPRKLGNTHSRFQTPSTALLAVMPLVIAVPAALLLDGAQHNALGDLLTLSAFGYLVTYLAVCVATPVFLRRIGELSRSTWIVAGAATAALTVIGGYAIARSIQAEPALVAVFAATLLIGTLIAAGLRRWAPRTLAAVGIYDETSQDDVSRGARRGIFR